MDHIQVFKVKFGLRGKNIKVPVKQSVHAIKLSKNKNRVKQYQDLQSPIINMTPNSLSKLPKRYNSVSRQSCQQKQIIPLNKQYSQHENNCGNCGKTEQNRNYHYRSILFRNRVNTHIESQLNRNQFISKFKKCTCGDCQHCLKDFNYFLNIFSNDKSLPDISAKSWCIWKKMKNQKFTYYFGKRIHKVRQIASLTKMITAMTAYDFIKSYNYDPSRIKYQIKKNSTIIGGTSANLQAGQVYTLLQLLYAMMLPSGNDAAIAISEVIGLIYSLKQKGKVNPYKQNWYQQHQTKSYGYLFIMMMNEKCQKMGLLCTKIFNSHGNDAYDQLKNVSTCNQIAKISVQYMQKYQLLKSIANTKVYSVQRYNKKWQNTNKLLDDGFEGIKTGINQSSGPCLSAYYRDIIIIVLNSKSMNQRWVQVKKLVRWIVRKAI